MPAASTASPKLFFFFFIPQPFTALTRQARKADHAIKRSISFDVYGTDVSLSLGLSPTNVANVNEPLKPLFNLSLCV